MVRTIYTPNRQVYRDYFLAQQGGRIPVFEGQYFQQGYGLGGIISKMFSGIIPLFAKIAKKPLAREVGKQLLSSGSSALQDVILHKKPVKRTVRKRAQEALKNVSEIGVAPRRKVKKKRANPKDIFG